MVMVKVTVNRLMFNQPKLDKEGNEIIDKEGKTVMSDSKLYRKGDEFVIFDLDRAEKLKRGNSVKIIDYTIHKPGGQTIKGTDKADSDVSEVTAGKHYGSEDTKTKK